MKITNISKAELDYLYSVINEDEKLKDFFNEVSFYYDRIRQSKEESLNKFDLEKELLKEKMQDKIDEIVRSGIKIDIYPENRITGYTWSQFYLSSTDDKVIFFNDFCFLFEDICYLMDFVKQHKNSVAEPTPVFPTEKKYLLELEDKKAIIEWEKKLAIKDHKIQKKYSMIPKIFRKGEYYLYNGKYNLIYCREMLKKLNEYEIMVEKLKKFDFQELVLISEYFELVEELRNLEAKKQGEMHNHKTSWERTYKEVLGQKDLIKKIEYAELIFFKQLLRIKVDDKLPEFKMYDRYSFSTEAVNSFLELNKEKFNNILISTFNDSKIDEIIKIKLKTFK